LPAAPGEPAYAAPFTAAEIERRTHRERPDDIDQDGARVPGPDLFPLTVLFLPELFGATVAVFVLKRFVDHCAPSLSSGRLARAARTQGYVAR
jgi:hypothetical protein